MREERQRRNVYQCRNCGKRFPYVQSMTRHRRQCEGAFHLSCPYCQKRFHRRDYYNDHLSRHLVMTPPAGGSLVAPGGEGTPLGDPGHMADWGNGKQRPKL
ncbi:hypothetical protein ACOMHN_036008 [Nucella lapillus]